MNEIKIVKIDKLEEEVKNYLANVKKFEITSHDDIVEYRKVRADLNKFRTAINRSRIDYTKKVKEKVDKTMLLVDLPISEIDSDIQKSIEDFTNNRREEVKLYLSDKIKNYPEIEATVYDLLPHLEDDDILNYRNNTWKKLVDVKLETIKQNIAIINNMNNAQDVLKHFYDTFDMVTALERTNAVEEEYEPIEARSVVITYKICDKHQRVINTLEALGIEYDIEYKEE